MKPAESGRVIMLVASGGMFRPGIIFTRHGGICRRVKSVVTTILPSERYLTNIELPNKCARAFIVIVSPTIGEAFG